MKRGALTRTPTARSTSKAERGRVYAGGSPNFDESTGRYTAPPRGSQRLSPGVYRTPSGQLMSGQGRVLPSQLQGQRLAGAMIPPSSASSPAALISKRPLAPNEPAPMVPPPVDMQKPWMNFQPPQMPQIPQRPQLSTGEVTNMPGNQIQRYLGQYQQAQQLPQSNISNGSNMQPYPQSGNNTPQGQNGSFNPNNPPAPGMQVNYNILGQPYWGYGQNIG